MYTTYCCLRAQSVTSPPIANGNGAMPATTARGAVMMGATVGRLELDLSLPQDHDKRELLNVYRESCANDRTMLFGLLDKWAMLTPPQRGALYRVAD